MIKTHRDEEYSRPLRIFSEWQPKTWSDREKRRRGKGPSSSWRRDGTERVGRSAWRRLLRGPRRLRGVCAAIVRYYSPPAALYRVSVLLLSLIFPISRWFFLVSSKKEGNCGGWRREDNGRHAGKPGIYHTGAFPRSLVLLSSSSTWTQILNTNIEIEK